MAKIINFVAHQDDDLLFMNPDILTDIKAGHDVWTVYLTAGSADPKLVTDSPSHVGMEYADKRINGEREAYKLMAGVDTAVPWKFIALRFGHHEIATNVLEGTKIKLLFTFIAAARGPQDPDGDLRRMWEDPNYAAQPLDGRAAYTQASFIEMLRDILEFVKPNYIRIQNSLEPTLGRGTGPGVNHVDHIFGSVFSLYANTYDSGTERCVKYRTHEYLDYRVRNHNSILPENLPSETGTEKRKIIAAYAAFDDELPADGWPWTDRRVYVRKTYSPGTLLSLKPGEYNTDPDVICAAYQNEFASP